MDDAAAKLNVTYVRYMDDWVVIAPSRWRLRKAVRVVNQQLSALQLRQHPDKTFIGKAERGFDFLSYHFTPKAITPAAISLKRCAERITRLHEQGADLCRMSYMCNAGFAGWWPGE